jgi:hypothetical protein
MRLVLSILITGLLCVSIINGKTYSPKVLTQHVADMSGDWQSFLNYPGFQGKSGQELAEALHNYFADSTTGFYHSTDSRKEGKWWVDNMSAYHSSERFSHLLVRDPVELVNIHGYGLCYHLNPVFAGICDAVNKFDSVCCGGYQQYHTMMEIHYDGDWHYFEPEQRGYVKEANGHILSWMECGADTSKMSQNPHNIFPYFPFPAGYENMGMITLESFKKYADSSYNVSGWSERANRQWSLCHTMDFILRRGESLRRYWQSDSNRVYIQREKMDKSHSNSYWAGEAQKLDTLLNKDPFGYRSWVPGQLGGSENTIGMGVLKYSPDMTSAGDYQDGVYMDSNMEHTSSGARLSQNGSGYVIFRTYSPYMIIGKPGDMINANDDSDGAKIMYVTAGQTTVKLSTNFGFDWKQLEQGSDLNGSKDVTVDCYGFHEYFIKFEFTGNAGEAGLSSFQTETWLSVAPMSLPRLKQGSNSISYSTGDVKGQNTVPIRFPIFISDSSRANRMIFSNSGSYLPYDLQHKVTGDMVFKITAPSNAKFKWVTLGASIVSGWNNFKDYVFSASPDNSSYTSVYTFARGPAWERHWHGFGDGTKDLAGYSNVLYAKYHTGGASNHGVNEVFIHAAYEEGANPSSDPVTVTYGYSENGSDKVYSFNASGDTSLSLDISGQVVNKYVEISVPKSSNLPVIKGKRGIKTGMGPRIDVYPNPISTSADIRILMQNAPFGSAQGDKWQNAKLEILDIAGRLVRTTCDVRQAMYIWDTSNTPGGVYFVKVNNGTTSLTRKIVLLR